MWIKRALTLLIIASALSCESGPQEQYTFNGTILGDYEGYVYLSYLKDDRDSALVENGKFTFTGTMPHVVEAGLSTAKGPTVESFYFGNETLAISFNFSDGYFMVDEQTGETASLIDSVYTYLSTVLESNPNPNEELNGYMTKIVSGHPDNQFISEMLSELIGEATYFSLEQSEALMALVDREAMVPEYLESTMTAMERMKNLNIGDPFIDFTLKDETGKEIKPSDFKGKYLLVDLWASWCGPCRKANPLIAQIYQEYKDKGFEVLSISVDTSEKAWTKAVAKDQLTWPNVRVEDGLGSQIAQDLGVVFLPYNYLIDPEGNIAKINVDLPTVISTLNSELSSTP